jgi:nucleolar GTP-binding protein
MNFQDLKTVEGPNFYLDVAIKRTKKKSEKLRQGSLRGSQLQRSKFIELSKLESIETELTNQLTSIVKSYPSFDNMSEFYKQMLETTLDVPYLKKSLASLLWCARKVQEFLIFYKRKIKVATEIGRINVFRREFYGRVSSALRQIKPHLEYLESARRTMLDYPSIKTGMTTVAIAGFPNVGKSTLLSRLTGSKAKIAAYAFTTKGINQGFAQIGDEKVQFLDTPGTLNRFERQNTVEKIATLAIKYVAEAIIYVFDLSEPYPLDQQVKLYEQLKKSNKSIMIYLSKTDVLDKDVVAEFKKEYKDAVTSAEEVKERLVKMKF